MSVLFLYLKCTTKKLWIIANEKNGDSLNTISVFLEWGISIS